MFNANFRQAIFAQIEKVEVNLRCRIANYFSVKYGDYEGEREGRYYTDYTEQSVETLFTSVSSLQKVDMWLTDDARPGRNDKWINCIYKKKIHN